MGEDDKDPAGFVFDELKMQEEMRKLELLEMDIEMHIEGAEDFYPKDNINSRFKGGQLKWLNDHDISVEYAERYNSQFSFGDITNLISAGFSPKDAEVFVRFRWDLKGVLNMDAQKRSEVLKFDERLRLEEILTLLEKGISSDDANRKVKEYSDAGYYRDIDLSSLILDNVPVKNIRALPFVPGYDLIKRLFGSGMDLREFRKRFEEYDALSKERQKVSGRKKNYDDTEKTTIFEFILDNVTIEDIKRYDNQFMFGDIKKLRENNISPEEANSNLDGYKGTRFYNRDEDHNAVLLILNPWGTKKGAVRAEVAKRYPKRFNALQIGYLHKEGISPEKTRGFARRFGIGDIKGFVDAGCPPKEANKYSPKIKRAYDLYAMGIRPDSFSQERQEALSELLNRASYYAKHISSSKKMFLIGTGIDGVVLSSEELALKFSGDIGKEYEMVKRVNDRYGGKQRNVIRLKGELEKGVVMHIQMIKGKSLEEVIREGRVDPDKVVYYGRCIANGLVEMRRSGVWYHRDIRPANIIIEKRSGKAVIIDLGNATKERKTEPLKNRRFGSPEYQIANDLISLGQVLYYASTGKHLFTKSETMGRSLTKKGDRIRDARNQAYTEKGRLRYYLSKVDRNIEDERVRYLIKTCLTARYHDYSKVKKIFDRFKGHDL